MVDDQPLLAHIGEKKVTQTSAGGKLANPTVLLSSGYLRKFLVSRQS